MFRRAKKGSKIGWYKRSISSSKYKAEMRWISNKRKKLKTYVKHHPNNLQAANRLKELGG